jgi:hypothetical protein
VCISGHNGESPNIPLVQFGAFPKDDRQKYKVVEALYNATMCKSGDNTMEALQRTLAQITAVPADDYFIVALTDANLGQYGISLDSIIETLTKYPKVNAHVVCIAGTRELQKAVRSKGSWSQKIHTALHPDTLPAIFKNIFASSLLSNM